jgi:hypothetical protein
MNMSTRKIPFEIVHGIQPREVTELIYLNQYEFRSVGADNFVTKIHKLHDRVREKLEDNSQKYKSRTDQKMREVQFEVGDEVLYHLRKEIFRRGTHNKLKMKKIRPCKILKKFTANSYEIEFLDNVGISLIFNVEDLYPYRRYEVEESYDQK